MRGAGGNLTAMKDMSFQAGGGRSYKYLLPSIEPLYEFAAGLSFTSFSLKPTASGATVALSSAPTPVCVDVTNTGKRASPVVVSLFSAPMKPPAGLRLVPTRQLIGFEKVLTSPGTGLQVCLEISDADVAMVDEAGWRIAFEGDYVLTFFDGASKVTSKASILKRRTVATIPPVDNPQPPCCQGSVTSCC